MDLKLQLLVFTIAPSAAGGYPDRMEERSTHARISIDQNGEVETRQLAAVREVEPDGPHSLLSLDIQLPDESDDDAA